eukprot:gene7949-8806_t
MLTFILCFAAAICSTQAFTVGLNPCNNPKNWCSSKEFAKKCGVLEYCKIEWGKTGRQFDTKFSLLRKLEKSTEIGASPVKVALYYESLCPGCRQFIASQLFPTFQKLDSSGILSIELVPYGNAQERQQGSQWEFFCQHGATECYGNLIESCALHLLNNNQTRFMPFISCLEYYGASQANAEYCAGIHKIDYTPIQTCVGSSQGNQLQHENALKTNALNPPHKFVPWITVNGVHTDAIQTQMQTNMLEYVCNTYQGTKPAACTNAKEKQPNVCYKN